MSSVIPFSHGRIDKPKEITVLHPWLSLFAKRHLRNGKEKRFHQGTFEPLLAYSSLTKYVLYFLIKQIQDAAMLERSE